GGRSGRSYPRRAPTPASTTQSVLSGIDSTLMKLIWHTRHLSGKKEPMDAQFSTRSQEVLGAAAKDAVARGRGHVEPAPLLAQPLAQADSIAVSLLEAAGASATDLAKEADRILSGLPTVSGSSVTQP